MIYHCGVQLKLRLNGATKAAPVRMLSFGGEDVPVNVTRHRLARRYVVRVSEDGSIRLTVPRGASISGGFAFAERQTDWILREIERQRLRSAPWVDGTQAWFRGEQVPIDVDDMKARIGSEEIPLDSAGADVRKAIEARFRGLASAELPERCHELAKAAGLNVSKVSVRDQRSRWGACSPKRVITLNWRLIQMPLEVSDYIIIHELMHLKQPNHSRKFWREVDAACSGWRSAERWLRTHGRELM